MDIQIRSLIRFPPVSFVFCIKCTQGVLFTSLPDLAEIEIFYKCECIKFLCKRGLNDTVYSTFN